MEAKRPSAFVFKGSGDLAQLNKDIAALKADKLPHIPHLLLVTTDYPYLPVFPHENQNTPFAWWEVKDLQYMTLVSDGERGIALAKGDWEDEFAGPPSNSDRRSSTTTPNSFNKDSKKPSVKYSIKDYKNMKQTGVKPSPKPMAADAERRPGHTRNISGVSMDSPMSRMPSLEGPAPEVKQNGASFSVSSVKETGSQDERSNAYQSSQRGPRVKSASNVNGHVDTSARDTPSKVSSKKLERSGEQRTAQPIKHALPPRPQSPRRERQVSDPNPHKRPLECGAAPPEKRTKIEPMRTPSNSQHSLPPRPSELRSETKKSPTKSHSSQSQSSQPSPQPRKAISKSETKHASKSSSEKPLDLPPLLSPLPADLDNGSSPRPSSGFSNIKKAAVVKKSSSGTPPAKPKPSEPDTIIVKAPPADSSPLSTPPKSSSSPFVLPPILSPSLPDAVEQELLRLQQKSAALNTVEARHEKARQPDAPGVARKTVKSKVGHPPKKSQAESSKSQDVAINSSKRQSLIVKLPYKKTQRKIIEQYLRLKPTPSSEFKKLEAERFAFQQPPVVSQKEPSDSDEDTPLATLSKPVPPPSRKRPVESTESRAAEPAPKRSKLPEPAEPPKPKNAPLKPPFNSPTPSGPNEKSLLSTPRKGDAMKTVAMRKVDSHDGLARTPQSANISTPASVEKPRVNGTDIRMASPELDRLKAEEKRLSQQANKLKHKMDDILKLKSDQRNNVSEPQRKLGLSVGIECIIVYVNAFSAKDRILQLQKLAPMPQNWESLIKLWEFTDSHTRGFPILQALSARLGVLCREELHRIYPDTKEFQGRDAKCLDMLKLNSKERDKLWGRSHASRGILTELGVAEVIGPWTTVPEATNFTMDVLGAYSKKEKVGWKREMNI
ncbi:Uncharacterized protein BP5553_08343 [Venustampulla echinocandica]|uniref:Uncharacterized protein n=1 Tax=Venustampulla echinocandica TaxID=2656787 RepID=A0A370TGG0_9HELO|nr:Uncharacterized protein BP5553_08343 [Venustampulla echinocandica]RDL33975.1 Uncharacterized protein BP5553_08343 [Venustampulla echinocandica]